MFNDRPSQAKFGKPDRAGRVGQAPCRFARGMAWLLLVAMAVTTTGGDDRVDAGDRDQQTSGQAAASPTTPLLADRGSLVICGGGGLPESVRREFLELAGGPKAKIVVIPTASGDADGPAAARAEFVEPWIKRGVASATVLHTRSKARADEPDFTRPLDDATGVWFGGGDQSRVTEVYLGTGVERALHRVLDRGGVIGGTSAGAAIMSRVMITGGRDQATVGTGFGFLPGGRRRPACPQAEPGQSAPRRPGRASRLDGSGRRRGHGAGGPSGATGGSSATRTWSSADHPVGGQPMRLDVFHDGDEGRLEDWKSRPSPAGPRR